MSDILEGFRDPAVARQLVDEIHRIAVEPCTLMEGCGTHTMAIAKHGLRGVMPVGGVHASAMILRIFAAISGLSAATSVVSPMSSVRS